MKNNEKKCPQCAEIIKLDAAVCKHCGHRFSENEITASQSAARRNRQIGCGLGIVLILAVGYCASQVPSQPDNPGPNTTNQSTAADARTSEGNQAAQSVADVGSQWSYNESQDEMRSAKTRYALVTSDNSVDFSFPYAGGSTLTLQLRQRPQDGFQILLSISSGQFLCNSFSNSTITVKFDDGPLRKFGCSDTSDGDSTVIFVESPKTFLKGLRKAKKTTIEADFFQEGSRQFTFDTANLKWK